MAHRKRSARPASKRQLRVAEEIRHALADVLKRGGLHDPVLTDVSVTVTEVTVAPDLKQATAFVTALGERDQTHLVEGLNKAAGWLRGQVVRQVRLKYAPTLRFVADETFNQAERIDALLKQTKIEASVPPTEADDGP